MKKLLWTFGLDTPYKGKCVITFSKDFNTAMEYVYDKYGQKNVSSNYPEPYFDIDDIVARWNYDILEEVTL